MDIRIYGCSNELPTPFYAPLPPEYALMAIHSSIRNNAPSSENCGITARVGPTDWGTNAVKIRIALGLLGLV
jgi:hypothetical protein